MLDILNEGLLYFKINIIIFHFTLSVENIHSFYACRGGKGHEKAIIDTPVYCFHCFSFCFRVWLGSRNGYKSLVSGKIACGIF